jgi:hypothetical protein
MQGITINFKSRRQKGELIMGAGPGKDGTAFSSENQEVVINRLEWPKP